MGVVSKGFIVLVVGPYCLVFFWKLLSLSIFREVLSTYVAKSQEAFDVLKERLATIPILFVPSLEKMCVI